MKRLLLALGLILLITFVVTYFWAREWFPILLRGAKP